MATWDVLVKGGHLVLPEGVVRGDIAIRKGRIAQLGEDLDAHMAEEVVDARGKVVLPGAVDAHFHLGIYRDLSQDAESETASALLGGVTTVLSYFRTGKDYLNRSGPYREIFPEVRERLDGHTYTDYGLHIAIMTSQQLEEVPWLVQQGVTSFKYYMFYKGLTLDASSTDAAAYTLADRYDLGHLYLLMQAIAQENRRASGRVSLSLHCENAEILRVFVERAQKAGTHDLRTYHEARPPLAEELAIAEAGVIAAETGCPVNLLHLSSARAVAAALALRRAYPHLDVRLETTLHHLVLTYDTAQGGTGAKVNPPIRTLEDTQALWEAVRLGQVQQVVSDHASIPEAKPQDLWQARAGFGGTALLYPVLLSEGYGRRGLSLPRVAELASAHPAQAFGLWPRKGVIALGSDADLAIVDLEETRTVTAEALGSAQPFTPFAGLTLRGWPVATLVRGRVAMAHGRVQGPPQGQYLARPLPAPVPA